MKRRWKETPHQILLGHSQRGAEELQYLRPRTTGHSTHLQKLASPASRIPTQSDRVFRPTILEITAKDISKSGKGSA